MPLAGPRTSSPERPPLANWSIGFSGSDNRRTTFDIQPLLMSFLNAIEVHWELICPTDRRTLDSSLVFSVSITTITGPRTVTGKPLAHHGHTYVLAVQVTHADTAPLTMLVLNLASDFATKHELPRPVPWSLEQGNSAPSSSFLSRCMDLGTWRSSGVPDRFIRHAGDDQLYLFDARALRIDIAGDHSAAT